MSLRPVFFFFLLQVELNAKMGMWKDQRRKREAFLRYLEEPGEFIFHNCFSIKFLSVEYFFCRYSLLMYA